MSAPAGTTTTDSTPSTATIPVSDNMLANLQRQYMQGKLCDLRVRCVVMPEHESEQQDPRQQRQHDQQDAEYTDKIGTVSELSGSLLMQQEWVEGTMWTWLEWRMWHDGFDYDRTMDDKQEVYKKEDESGSQGRATDILCHANVLCARSPYFDSSLSGGWSEAQTKTVEVALENEQAVQDMKLLIKLCYSGSYTKDGETLLDLRTRIRLAFLGNAFEMPECVSECVASLADDLTPAEALTLLDEVLEELRGHEAMTGVKMKVITVLADALDNWTESDPPTATQKSRKQKFINALAKALGPVDQLSAQGKWLERYHNSFYTCLPLKPHILALPPAAIEALLASDALNVTTENEVYTLLGCWLYQSPFAGAYDGSHSVTVADCLPLFERFVKLVGFQHISLEFIGNVVSACPLANESGLLPSILRSGLITRETNCELLSKEGVPGSVLPGRGRGGPGWTYKSTLNLADLLPLGKDTNLHTYVGLVDGYFLRIRADRQSDKHLPEATSFGIYVFVVMPVWQMKTWEGSLDRNASFEYRLRVGSAEWGWAEHLFAHERGWGYLNLFRYPWEEVVHEGSAYFPGGQIMVEVGMRLLQKGHRNVV